MPGRWFERIGPRRRTSPDPSAADIADDLRATIVRLDAQRAAATRLAGRAFVNQAEVRRACHEQLDLLTRAAHEAQRGELLAADAAADAAAEAAGDAAAGAGPDARHDRDLDAFASTAAGLRTVQDTLDLAGEPVRALLVTAQQNADRAQDVLARAREVFDEQVRAQVRLLVALERAERARIARAHRR